MKVSRSQTLQVKLRPVILPSCLNFSKVQKMQLSQSCPEVCQLTPIEKQKLRINKKQIYIHHLKIDYGKLQKLERKVKEIDDSSCIWVDKTIKQLKNVQQQIQKTMQHQKTMRISKISQFSEKGTFCQKETIKKRIKYLKTETSSPKHSKKKSQKILDLSSLSNSTNLKNVKQLSQLKQTSPIKKIGKEYRMVKLMVAGGYKKTMLVCYPDTSEYHKLCHLN